MAKVKAKKSEVVVETKKDIIKKQKEIKRKNQRELSETETEVRNFIVLLVIVIALIGVVYFVTTKVINNQTNNEEVTIQYDEINVGMILNRSEYEEYYVVVYFSSGANSNNLYSLYRTYTNRDNAKKVHVIDIENEINRKFIATDNKSVLNVTDVNNIRFAEEALLHVKDGKIIKTYSGYTAIENILK